MAAGEAVTRATIVARAITNRAIPAMNRRASARIIQVAHNNPVNLKASVGSKVAEEAGGDVGVGVADGAGIAMTAEVRNQKASKAAARSDRTL